jgi:hypothetical protein
MMVLSKVHGGAGVFLHEVTIGCLYGFGGFYGWSSNISKTKPLGKSQLGIRNNS